MRQPAQPPRNNVVAHFLSVIDWEKCAAPFGRLILKRNLGRQEIRKIDLGRHANVQNEEFRLGIPRWFTSTGRAFAGLPFGRDIADDRDSDIRC
jgi:hypothetical protein